MITKPDDCVECLKKFDIENKIPLVMQCGDSICMACAVGRANEKVYQCPVCREKQRIGFEIVKDMPVNKALLEYIQGEAGPGNRNSGFQIGDDRKVDPFLISQGDAKCARPGCANDKYSFNEIVYKYCGLVCYEADNPAEFNEKISK